MLRVEFAELEELGFDLGLTGFELDEVQALEIGEIDDDASSRELDDGKYTTKIDTPIYEIKGDKPAISDL